MSATLRVDAECEVSAGSPNGNLMVQVVPEGNSCVVHLQGELDLATRHQLFMASTAGNHPAMVIDLAGVSFMDCGAYGSLVAARAVVEREGRTLTNRGKTGQPARLFDLIETLERSTLPTSYSHEEHYAR